jgi:hypothetical protein
MDLVRVAGLSGSIGSLNYVFIKRTLVNEWCPGTMCVVNGSTMRVYAPVYVSKVRGHARVNRGFLDQLGPGPHVALPGDFHYNQVPKDH